MEFALTAKAPRAVQKPKIQVVASGGRSLHLNPKICDLTIEDGEMKNYAEGVNYWKTSRTGPDAWLDKAKSFLATTPTEMARKRLDQTQPALFAI